METSEHLLSERNRPPYLKWLIKNKKLEVFLTLAGIVGCCVVTPSLLAPDVILYAKIGGFVAMYGFTVAMALQPYTIYQNLRKLNYWSPNSPWQKEK